MTPWTVARRALQSMGFSRQEYWSGLPFPLSGGLLDDSGIEPGSPALHCRQMDSLPVEPPGKPIKHEANPRTRAQVLLARSVPLALRSLPSVQHGSFELDGETSHPSRKSQWVQSETLFRTPTLRKSATNRLPPKEMLQSLRGVTQNSV